MSVETTRPLDDNEFIIMDTGTTEMLRIGKDGFYVRGVKIEQDEKEAEKVYVAFHQWLTWATLQMYD
jgi:hypothetical protein